MTRDQLRVIGRNIRVHGNGFLQLDLNPHGTLRLHVWHDGLPRQVVATPIHDHVFDMESEVLYGTLIHDHLKAVGDEEHGTHLIYRAMQEPHTQNTILVADKGAVRLEVEQHLILQAGSRYTFPKHELHTSGHGGLTVTLMRKVNSPSTYGRPRVLVPIGQEPDNDFHRDGFDDEYLWSYVDMVAAYVPQYAAEDS